MCVCVRERERECVNGSFGEKYFIDLQVQFVRTFKNKPGPSLNGRPIGTNYLANFRKDICNGRWTS